MIAAYDAAKAVDPDIEIAIGGLIYQGFFGQVTAGTVFADQMLQARPELASAYDAVAVHPYASYPPIAPPERDDDLETPLVDMLAEFRTVFETHTERVPRLWITEIGWPTFQALDAPSQAAFLARAFLLSAEQNVESFCWFTLVDGANHGDFPPESDFGLVRYHDDRGGAPKPAYVAYRTLLEELAGTRVNAPMGQLPDDVRSVAFADGAREVVAVWSTADARTVTLPVAEGATLVTAVYLDGATEEMRIDDATVEFVADSLPLLVVFE